MNAMDIITGLNGIRDSYVVSAGEFRQGTRRAGRLSGRRLWLIAAIVALTLLLVGCAALYVLRLQNMVVGKYTFSIPTEYDENGEVIPVESREPVTLLSVQGTNMDALREWVAFTNAYDPDGTIMLEADLAAKSGAPSSIPENYEYTYGCYSQEMVDKLNALVEAYHLKLLSRYIPFNVWENSVLFRSLGLGSLVYDDPRVQVKYWDGSFHPEGTFGLTMDIRADMGDWELRQEFAGYHYSLKDYFDPSTDSMLESRDYTQWDYTRRDGQRVLLVLSEGTARIYAEKPEAFLSIYLDPVICVDGEEVPMTQTALQQLAELFDLSVSPTPATAEQIAQYRAQALAEHEATRAQARAEHEAMYAVGYREYVDYLLETAPNPEGMSYALYDVNGDGVEELVIAGRDILSMKDGQSYRYFDLTGTGIIFPSFRPCEGNRFEIYCEVLGMNQHFFYQANAESAVFLTGVSCDDPGGTWYLHQSDGSSAENRQPITQQEAQAILDAFSRVDFHWSPLKRFGETPVTTRYSDPYAQFIAEALLRYESASTYTYALMDLNGDGTEELIVCRNTERMEIYTIRDGACVLYADSISHICAGGILEICEESQTDSGRYYGFYRCGADGTEFIEKVVRDPYTLYWGYARAGQDGAAVREEKAMEVLASYQQLTLHMHPFAHYPME